MMLKTLSLVTPLCLTALAFPTLEPRQNSTDVDCAPNSRSGLKAECWEALNIEQYINDWIKANGTEAKCDEVGFAQCFLQANGFSGLTCDLITSNTCPPFDTDANAKYESNQQFYTLWNIYAVYQFFQQYSLALGQGSSLAAGTVGQIVSAVAPPVEAVASVNNLKKIFSGTLGVLGLIGGVIPNGGSTAAGLIIGGLTQVLNNVDVSEKLLTQTANDRFLQLGDVEANLSELVKEFQDALLNTVSTIQGNHTYFIQTCSKGGFSQRVTTSLTVQASDLYRQLQQYILSEALKANGIVSTLSEGLDPRTVAADTGEISCDAFTSGGNCNQWYYDEAEGNTYAFHNPNSPETNFADLTNLITEKGWATQADIHKTQDCQGKSTEFDPATVQATCLSTHGFCTYNYTDVPPIPQFKDCDADPSWLEACGSFVSTVKLPESYLGPLLAKGNCRF
ncbi:hypothetical protein BFW01_g8574 [Lasiodiplodia theobromae]|uniref:Uncharacterized protein n=1 Tax=Lasiodiplodia theobromae TaxID=45133 RepID=A0A5N5DI14_9PEZI|nr:hypothetical protein DBV05_g4038 [Lasiodiplodia theobromae]KAF9637678.1 hypothetical protein BFW01_g8574 [Lasiodiplodia theobromae]